MYPGTESVNEGYSKASVRFVKLEVGGPFGPQREQGPPQLSQLSEVGGPFFKRHPSRATA